MRRNKAKNLDYFVDGQILIPALFLSLEDHMMLLDAAYDDIIILKSKPRRRGA